MYLHSPAADHPTRDVMQPQRYDATYDNPIAQEHSYGDDCDGSGFDGTHDDARGYKSQREQGAQGAQGGYGNYSGEEELPERPQNGSQSRRGSDSPGGAGGNGHGLGGDGRDGWGPRAPPALPPPQLKLAGGAGGGGGSGVRAQQPSPDRLRPPLQQGPQQPAQQPPIAVGAPDRSGCSVAGGPPIPQMRPQNEDSRRCAPKALCPPCSGMPRRTDWPAQYSLITQILGLSSFF